MAEQLPLESLSIRMVDREQAAGRAQGGRREDAQGAARGQLGGRTGGAGGSTGAETVGMPPCSPMLPHATPRHYCQTGISDPTRTQDPTRLKDPTRIQDPARPKDGSHSAKTWVRIIVATLISHQARGLWMRS